MNPWLVAGDPAVDGFEGSHLVFVGAGSDPFETITYAVKYVSSLNASISFHFCIWFRYLMFVLFHLHRSVEKHLQTFAHRDRKKVA